MGHNGIFRNDTCDAYETTAPNWREKRPVKSLVVGRPILLALEDIDGRPSFLEKALRYLEKHGIRVEGILRQAADVEEVDRRLCEYEQGRTEFAPGEDAHIIGDCVKHVLRELPSSPVPASCCTVLLEAFRKFSVKFILKCSCTVLWNVVYEMLALNITIFSTV
ncbi:rho GTPase-activating protein 6-like [Triticum urartu]|uniref:rho GTPase-activating protein 6-like n=1 Tax=Triticum urartu TaxID=4572 RepID=UPI0020432AB0|nr:rho GTPase-activating protein 6-like [Triticum urartu]